MITAYTKTKIVASETYFEGTDTASQLPFYIVHVLVVLSQQIACHHEVSCL